MKNYFYLVVLLTSLTCSCAQQMAWQYSMFSDNAMPLNQAQAICQGYADNAAAGIVAEKAPDNIQCHTNYSGYSASTNCQNNNALQQYANNVRASNKRKEVTQNYFRSCMAEKGWNANLVPVSTAGYYTSAPVAISAPKERLVTCKNSDGEIIGTDIPEGDCFVSLKGSPGF